MATLVCSLSRNGNTAKGRRLIVAVDLTMMVAVELSVKGGIRRPDQQNGQRT
jgi:hypothetical protein